MPSIYDNNSAAALLADLDDDDGLTLDRLALQSGVSAEHLHRCRDQKMPLAFEEQVNLARAIKRSVPRLAAKARRLEEQAMAARRMELGSTSVHKTAPPKWW
jgi:hypothetical protein